MLVGDQGEAVTEAVTDLLSPLGLLLLPVLLLVAIHFLSSSDRLLSSLFSSTGQPDSIHRLSGSPLGVALLLLLLLLLLYHRVSLFGSGDHSDD
ncbi:hypothetical protein Syun_007918 [Stephania yunnanensis]|uniref:Uncharacterized protein n=1 Tax=Stephania yunnanensis TaxID=152371 RepID=A0AAP0KZA7_9MAGN